MATPCGRRPRPDEVGGDRAGAPLLRAREQGGAQSARARLPRPPRPGNSCPAGDLVDCPPLERGTSDGGRLRFPLLTGVLGGRPAAC